MMHTSILEYRDKQDEIREPHIEGSSRYKLAESDTLLPSLFHKLSRTSPFPITSGNKIRILINGEQIFPAIIDDLISAKQSIDLSSYVFDHTYVAEDIAEVLCQKAREGIRCRVLLDGLNASPLFARNGKFVSMMKNNGVQVELCYPIHKFIRNKPWQRNHAKIIVIDGKIGFTGGAGIADRWDGDADSPRHYRETHLRLEGPVVQQIGDIFNYQWQNRNRQLDEVIAQSHTAERPSNERDVNITDTKVLVVFKSPRSAAYSHEPLPDIIKSARKRLWITTSYFAPPPNYIHEICDAAKRGVDVRLIVPGPYSEVKLVGETGRSYYGALLKCGVKIFEYQRSMLHPKTLLCDDVALIGSTNWDYFSIKSNDEMDLLLSDPQITRQLESNFKQDSADSREITEQEWNEEFLGKHLYLKTVSYLIRRFL